MFMLSDELVATMQGGVDAGEYNVVQMEDALALVLLAQGQVLRTAPLTTEEYRLLGVFAERADIDPEKDMQPKVEAYLKKHPVPDMLLQRVRIFLQERNANHEVGQSFQRFMGGSKELPSLNLGSKPEGVPADPRLRFALEGKGKAPAAKTLSDPRKPAPIKKRGIE
jgi:hypothetical protein